MSIDDFLREYKIVDSLDHENRKAYFSVDTQNKIVYLVNAKTQEDRHLFILEAYQQYRRD